MIVHVLDWVATAGIVVIFISVVRLWFVSRSAHAPEGRAGAADEFLFAFLVPALNEAGVIEQTLDRLLDLPVRNSIVLVIDDGSNDGTGAVVRHRHDPRVRLLRREPPDAQCSKGAALNAGLARLRDEAADWPDDKVIVGIMDADGRLDPQALDRVAPYFAAPDVGAVQIGVRIFNRGDGALARMQDMEFVTYTDVYQSARDRWGVAGLGGNGQFVRLAALIDLMPAPWTDGLSEDLEQRLRLVSSGWRTRYCRDVAVHQQGLVSMRRLVRQRSRWFQGHLQAWRQIPGVVRRAPLRTVPHLLHSLLVPVLLLANVLLLAALGITVGELAFSPAGRAELARPGLLLDWYWLTFALALLLTLSVYVRRERGLRTWRAIALGHSFAIYSLLWMVAGYWALGRIVRGRHGWLKTERVTDHPAHGPRPEPTAAESS
ncbi:MAG TPA: glycosyltransferase [Streptosporangiaceae bacterium]|nr:glycosyltransferase [Streptosporangiaceae bacterium]